MLSDYIKKKERWDGMKNYWHIHHDVLMELSNNIRKRRADIKYNKPYNEIAIRLKLLRPVKGKLPKIYLKAEKAYINAQKTSTATYKIYLKSTQTNDTIINNANKISFFKALKNLQNKKYNLNKTRKIYNDKIEALHKKECPKCAWNGHTMFPKKINLV